MQRRFTLLSLAALALIFAALHSLPITAIQIRPDTGDLRYLSHGIPLQTTTTPEPQRSTLLALAAIQPPIPAAWCSLPHQRAAQLLHLYPSIPLYAAADPTLARLLLEDLAANIQPTSGTPPDLTLLDPSTPDSPLADPTHLSANWKSNPLLQSYAAAHHHTLK